MRASILTIAITCLGLLQLFGQDEVEFKVAKDSKPVATGFYYYLRIENIGVEEQDTFLTSHMSHRDKVFTLSTLRQLKDSARQMAPNAQTMFEYLHNNDTISVRYNYGLAISYSSILFIKTQAKNTTTNFSFANLLENSVMPEQKVTFLSDTIKLKLDSVNYDCTLIVLSRDTLMPRFNINIRGNSWKMGKKKMKTYTYCYLRNNDYLPLKIVETRPTPDPAEVNIPPWLVARYWQVKILKE